MEILGQVRGHGCCSQRVRAAAEDGNAADAGTLIRVDLLELCRVIMNNNILFIERFARHNWVL